MSDFISAFRAAMADAGLPYSGEIKADKHIHRFKPDNCKEGASGWYCLHPDGRPAGSFGDWRDPDNKTKWSYQNGDQKKLSKEEYAECIKRWKADEIAKEKEEAERWDRRAVEVVKEIAALTPCQPDHLYLQSKKLETVPGLLQNTDGELVSPLADATGKVWSYQTIDPFGDKRFFLGARVKGCFFQIGKTDDGPLIICEGVATGATIHRATGWPVVCAMNCGNLKQVALDLRGKHPDKSIIVACDDDRFTDKNPGITKGTEAANAIHAHIATPNFPADSKGTDFNDLACECGDGIVRGTFQTLVGIGMGQRITIRELLDFVPGEDKDSMLGDRFLCKGGSCVIVGQTSAGKSSLGMQMAILFALGMDFFGLKPRRPLRSLIIQAENDIGDTAEMFQGILQGLGLISNDDPEGAAALIKVLMKNLIIIRDQTHIGPNFAKYAERMVEIHKPDLFWIDPLLSFYGNDINDQQAMSTFLRAELNPISERLGIIWMLMHHTGKPAKDGSKTQKSWSSRDFAYMGLGSSELSNWARAIITVVNTSEDEFRMIVAKRGRRSGLQDDHGNPTTELNLAHCGDHICWKRIPKPKENDEMEDIFSAFARTIDKPMTASAIVKRAAEKLQRGSRTLWKFWDGGEGVLGRLFDRDSVGFYVPKNSQKSKPYKDD